MNTFMEKDFVDPRDRLDRGPQHKIVVGARTGIGIEAVDTAPEGLPEKKVATATGQARMPDESPGPPLQREQMRFLGGCFEQLAISDSQIWRDRLFFLKIRLFEKPIIRQHKINLGVLGENCRLPCNLRGKHQVVLIQQYD